MVLLALQTAFLNRVFFFIDSFLPLGVTLALLDTAQCRDALRENAAVGKEAASAPRSLQRTFSQLTTLYITRIKSLLCLFLLSRNHSIT